VRSYGVRGMCCARTIPLRAHPCQAGRALLIVLPEAARIPQRALSSTPVVLSERGPSPNVAKVQRRWAFSRAAALGT